jgi:hypothetical protein
MYVVQVVLKFEDGETVWLSIQRLVEERIDRIEILFRVDPVFALPHVYY